jgi:hypothetical protein
MPVDGALELAAFCRGCFEDEGAELVDFAVDEDEAEEAFCGEEARDSDEEFFREVKKLRGSGPRGDIRWEY